MKKLLAGLTLSSALLLSACGAEEPAEEPADTTEDVAPGEESTTDETGTEDAETQDPEETETDQADTASSDLQDGTYAIEDQNYGETGWREGLEITVENGEITEANWMSVNEEGTNKIEDEEYQEAMSGVVDVGPQDYIPALEESLVENQDPAQVDVVTGATGTSEKFQDYAQQLVEAAQEGNTETIEVDNQE